MPVMATDCICGKHLLQVENENVCVWCGHGLVHAIREHAYRRNMVAVDPALDRLQFAEDGARRMREGRQRGGDSARFRRAWNAEDCVRAAREWEQLYGRLPACTDWATAHGDRVEHPTYQTILNRFGGWPAFMREIADVPRERIAA